MHFTLVFLSTKMSCYLVERVVSSNAFAFFDKLLLSVEALFNLKRAHKSFKIMNKSTFPLFQKKMKNEGRFP